MNFDLYPILLEDNNIQLNLNKEFIIYIKNEILKKYKTLRRYHRLKRNNLSYSNLKYLFSSCKFYSIKKINDIMMDFDINRELLINNVICFRFHGSHVETRIPRFLNIDNKFVQGYSLYIAEGDTGLSGKNKPQKLRLTSSDLPIISFFRDWILKYFKQNLNDIDYYIYIPLNEEIDYKKYEVLLSSKNLHIYYDKSVTVPKYRISVDRKLIIDLFLKIEDKVKELVLNSNELSSYYLKGIFDGEGTAYCKKFKYIRLEMKNKVEVEFLSKLLINLKINHTLKERNTRKGMYTIYLSRKDNINKFSDFVGFELVSRRQEVLNRIVNYYDSYSPVRELSS